MHDSLTPETASTFPDLTGLRLLVVSQPTTHGLAVCVRDQVGAAVAAGADVVLAAPEDGPLGPWAEGAGARWVRVPMRREPELRDARWAGRLRGLARAADVVHLHSSKAGADGRLAVATLRRRPPVVFSPHAWSWLVGGRRAPAYRAFERLAAGLATVIIAVSEEERAAGARVLGRRAATRIRVIENGVDTERIRPDGSRVDAPHPLLVCVGRLTEQKGQSLLLDAVARLRDPGTHLALVGDGPQRAQLVDQARALGIAPRVEFVGEVDDPTPWMRSADVVVVPSYWDGMSIALLEAMACGAPIVATRVAGASAVAGVGEVVDVGDAAQLAAAVDALLGDPERRAALGRAARDRVVDRYDLRRSLAATMQVWKDVTR